MCEMYFNVLNCFRFEYLQFDLDGFLVNVGDPEGIQNEAEHVGQEKKDIRQNQPFVSDHRNAIMDQKSKQEQTSIQYNRIVKFLSD